jgi:hypothetical protein
MNLLRPEAGPILVHSDAYIGFIILARLSGAVSIDTLCPYIFIVSSSLLNIMP